MSLQGLFGILDYLIYLVRSTNRHGVHSPFVYHFTDRVLYGKSSCEYEAAAEMCRKRMVQSSRKVDFGSQSQRLSKLALNVIPSAKHNRLLFRWIQDQQLGKHIVEIGSSFGVTPLYLQRGPQSFSRYWVFDRQSAVLKITDYNLHKYDCNETINQIQYQQVDEIMEQLAAIEDGQLDMLIINETLEPDSFWRLMDWVTPKLGPNGSIVMTTLRKSETQQLLWQQLQNQKEITVGIDLFAMGMAFARKTQVKENFILRY